MINIPERALAMVRRTNSLQKKITPTTMFYTSPIELLAHFPQWLENDANRRLDELQVRLGLAK